MKQLRTAFEYILPNGNKINVVAYATDVTPYEAVDLEFHFLDADNVPFVMDYDANTFDELEALATEALGEVKFSPDVSSIYEGGSY